MARKAALTAKAVAAIKGEGVHWISPALYLQIRNNGARSYLARFTWQRKPRWRGLGSVHDTELDDARHLAAQLARQARRGIDPDIELKAMRPAPPPTPSKAPTLSEAWETVVQINEPTWSDPRSAEKWRNTFRDYIEPTLGQKRVDQITREDVVGVLKPIWETIYSTATRIRERFERVMAWTVARGYRSDNPADRELLQFDLPSLARTKKPEHRPSLPYDKLPDLMERLRQDGSSDAEAMRFLILTASRTKEVIEMRWSEVDGNVWTVPSKRMKARNEHRIPLSDAAVAILASRPRDGEFVFGGKKPMAKNRLRVFLPRLVDNATPHGFRASFDTWASERTDFSPDLIDRSMAHKVGTAVTRAYRRTDLLDQRRELMEAWARFLTDRASAI